MDEQEYSKHTNDGVSRCGSLHDPDDVITMYINVLDLALRTLIKSYGETHRRATYLEVVEHSKYKEEVVRA